MCDRDDPGAAWPVSSGRLLRMSAGYGAHREALEPLLRLVLDAAALVVLLRGRSPSPGESGRGTAVQQ